MDEKVSEAVFGGTCGLAVAAELSSRSAPFTATDMQGWIKRPRSSVDRALARMEKAGLLVKTATIFSKSRDVPDEFWTGCRLLFIAATTAAVTAESD